MLKEVAGLYRFSRWQRWKIVILPGIFPYLVTGLVTASAIAIVLRTAARSDLLAIKVWQFGDDAGSRR